MTLPRHIPEDDLALFALALMQPEEAALTLAHLKHCDVCRGEVARLQGDLLTYAMTAEMHSPPPEARDRLLRAVAKERKFLPQTPVPQPAIAVRQQDFTRIPVAYEEPKRGTGLFSWAGWAIAAGLAGLAGWQFYQGQDMRRTIAVESAALDHVPESQPNGDIARAREVLQTLTDPTAMQVAMHFPVPHKVEKPEAHAAYVATTGDLIFVASHLRPLPGNRTYELWLLPASGNAPLPAGLFRPDANGNASVVLPTLPKNIAAKGFGVTEESDGGTTRPTPPILLAGS